MIFTENTFNLTTREKEYITSWLEEVLLDEEHSKNKILSSKLLYDGLKDGFSGKSYVTNCDKHPNKFVIVQTEYQNIFGGFASVNTDLNIKTGFHKDSKAFLCLIRTKDACKEPVLCKISKKSENNAFYYDEDVGPVFGDVTCALLLDDKNTKYSNWLFPDCFTDFDNMVTNHIDFCAGFGSVGLFEFSIKNIQVYRIDIS